MGGGCAVAALSGRIKGAALLLAALTLAGCTVQIQAETDPPTPAPTAPAAETPAERPAPTAAPAAEPAEPVYDVTPGSETYRDFTLDNVYHSDIGDIHFNLYLPESYDGGTPYALFITLPGWQGLYFRGVGVNLQTETFGFAAQGYVPDMIVAAPQLNGWDEQSGDEAIALTEYLLDAYNIDPGRVYIEGYSGGGETLSWVLGKRPDLYAAALLGATRWDGAYQPVVDARTLVYLAVGEGDEYYGPEPLTEAYAALRERYRQAGLSNAEIDELLVLDVKDADYFAARGLTNQHGGGQAFAEDAAIMGWLFGRDPNAQSPE